MDDQHVQFLLFRGRVGSQSFVKSCRDAIQIHGGAGFLAELGLERELCDSVGSTLYSGTSEIQRNIIARGLRL